jgi:hypothetical protein
LLKNIFHNGFVVVGIDFAITLRTPDRRITAFKTFDISKDAELAKCMPTVDNGMCESIQAAADHASKDIGKFLWTHGFLMSSKEYHLSEEKVFFGFFVVHKSIKKMKIIRRPIFEGLKQQPIITKNIITLSKKLLVS